MYRDTEREAAIQRVNLGNTLPLIYSENRNTDRKHEKGIWHATKGPQLEFNREHCSYMVCILKTKPPDSQKNNPITRQNYVTGQNIELKGMFLDLRKNVLYIIYSSQHQHIETTVCWLVGKGEKNIAYICVSYMVKMVKGSKILLLTQMLVSRIKVRFTTHPPCQHSHPKYPIRSCTQYLGCIWKNAN